jgi:hypothetical protein
VEFELVEWCSLCSFVQSKIDLENHLAQQGLSHTKKIHFVTATETSRVTPSFVSSTWSQDHPAQGWQPTQSGHFE